MDEKITRKIPIKKNTSPIRPDPNADHDIEGHPATGASRPDLEGHLATSALELPQVEMPAGSKLIKIKITIPPRTG